MSHHRAIQINTLATPFPFNSSVHSDVYRCSVFHVYKQKPLCVSDMLYQHKLKIASAVWQKFEQNTVLLSIPILGMKLLLHLCVTRLFLWTIFCLRKRKWIQHPVLVQTKRIVMPALFAFIANQNQNSIWQQPQHRFASLTDGFSPKLAAFSRAPGIFSFASSFFLFRWTHAYCYLFELVQFRICTSGREGKWQTDV